MAQYGDNLAYDLSLFEEKKETAAPEKQPEKQQEKLRERNSLKLLKIAAAFSVCAFLAGAILYSNATLAELNSRSFALEKQLATLKDEETRMNVELDSRVCMKDIDEYITDDLGMVKLEKYQVNYIDLSEDDSMVVTQEEKNLWQRIGAFFEGIGEYFR